MNQRATRLESSPTTQAKTARAIARRGLSPRALLFGVAFLALVVAALLALPGAQASESVDFASQIFPILEASCIDCHGPKEDFSNLRLDNADGIMKGGDLGTVVTPGAPDESSLYGRVILDPMDLDIMPVEGDPLTEEETELIRKWIEQGADFGGWTGE